MAAVDDRRRRPTPGHASRGLQARAALGVRLTISPRRSPRTGPAQPKSAAASQGKIGVTIEAARLSGTFDEPRRAPGSRAGSTSSTRRHRRSCEPAAPCSDFTLAPVRADACERGDRCDQDARRWAFLRSPGGFILLTTDAATASPTRALVHLRLRGLLSRAAQTARPAECFSSAGQRRRCSRPLAESRRRARELRPRHRCGVTVRHPGERRRSHAKIWRDLGRTARATTRSPSPTRTRRCPPEPACRPRRSGDQFYFKVDKTGGLR